MLFLDVNNSKCTFIRKWLFPLWIFQSENFWEWYFFLRFFGRVVSTNGHYISLPHWKCQLLPNCQFILLDQTLNILTIIEVEFILIFLFVCYKSPFIMSQYAACDRESRDNVFRKVLIYFSSPSPASQPVPSRAHSYDSHLYFYWLSSSCFFSRGSTEVTTFLQVRYKFETNLCNLSFIILTPVSKFHIIFFK